MKRCKTNKCKNKRVHSGTYCESCLLTKQKAGCDKSRRLRGCVGKVKHFTWNSADLSIKDRAMQPYLCEYCNYYHVGH